MVSRGGSRGGRRGLEPRSDCKIPNFLKIEIIGFCLTTSSHKSNFHASHAHHTHNAQNWSVEPPSDFRLDPPLVASLMMKMRMMMLPIKPSSQQGWIQGAGGHGPPNSNVSSQRPVLDYDPPKAQLWICPW